MDAYAPVPGEAAGNFSGLSVLDLVKHAALTMIENLDERDRLGVVTFSETATTLLGLTSMTEENKVLARAKVRSMVPQSTTNLWAGIETSLGLAKGHHRSGAVPAIIVLTDGVPNLGCPDNGYVAELRKQMPLPATIHTFGFGYRLRSGMLQSIAEVGGGNYAFIPDSGMVGTVFVHAVANLQATFAMNATLEITYKTPLKIEEAMGNAVHSSRDIVLNMPGLAAQVKDGVLDSSTWFIDASLGFEAIIDGNGSRSMAGARRNVTLASGLPEEELAYHLSRAQLCAFLSNLFPMRQDMEHVCDPDVATGHLMRQKFQHLLDTIPARKYIDQRNRSLMDDLKGANPHGQISMVIHDCNFFVRWGQHYLPSLQNAHTRQYCSSFKDPGPLQYGTDSPLFIACRDRLEETFDKLPPPIPSLQSQQEDSRVATWNEFHGRQSMSNDEPYASRR
ncbi:hypothetical protein K4F52_005700 [Lecanicillium sp. MT-2017a]|nr:hypothetical protein K4F52_005700 [Lecanicillium sp. MT-2017a]